MDREQSKREAMDALDIDAELYDELTGIFLAEADEAMDTLRAALDGSDLGTVKGEAHKIRGGAGNLRLEEIRRLANAIEDAAAAGEDGDEIHRDATLLGEALAALGQSRDSSPG